MGNNRAREFQKTEELRLAWQRARTQERHLYQDVCGVQGLGARRLTIIYCPSFERGYSWDIRKAEDEFTLYRSRVQPGAQSLKGYELLQFPSRDLKAFLARIRNIKIALHPTGDIGLDGTTYHLGLSHHSFSSIWLRWWSEPQEEWKEISAITNQMVERFSSAAGAESTDPACDGKD